MVLFFFITFLLDYCQVCFVYFIKIFYKNSEGRDLETILGLDKAPDMLRELENKGIKTRFEIDGQDKLPDMRHSDG